MPWRCIRQICPQRGPTAPGLRHEQGAFRQILSQSRSQIAVRYSSTSPNTPSSLDSFVSGHADPLISAETTRAPPVFSKFSRNVQLTEQSPPSGSKVKVAGLVRSIRKQKRVAFAHISDGSTFQPVQAILSPDNAKDLHNGAYVELAGIWKESPGAAQSHEMHVEEVLYVGESDVESSPIQKKSMTVDHLRTYPHLRLRLPLYSLLTRVRNQVISSVHAFYSGISTHTDEAIYVQPPIITSSDCEGAGEVFTVSPKLHVTPHREKEDKEQKHYFREQKYLTVSSQLHLEAFAAELGDVWTITSAFRAEESDTGRHLAELNLLEFEGRGITELEELMDGVQRLIQHIVRRLLNHRTSEELVSYYESDKRHRPEDYTDPNLPARWKALSEPDWLHITYADAMEALEAAARQQPNEFKHAPAWDDGLSLEHERWIVQNLGRDRPVFVTHYPKKQKPFYMLPGPNSVGDNETSACFDLLLPYGICEVVGGSLREHRLENLIQNMREKGLLSNHAGLTEADADYPYLRDGESLGSMSWYADLRRYGGSPHGGWGLGLERLLMYLTGVPNVRDIVTFPRTYKNCIA